MIVEIISDSVKYSVANKKHYLQLSLMCLLHIFLIPFIINEGYSYKIIKESLNSIILSGDELPSYTNFLKLIKNGIRMSFVKIVYYLIPITIFELSFTYGYINLFSNRIFVNLTYIIGLTLIFIVNFYLYVAIPHMAKYDSISKAFSIREINKIIREKISLKTLITTYIGSYIIIGGITTITLISIIYGSYCLAYLVPIVRINLFLSYFEFFSVSPNIYVGFLIEYLIIFGIINPVFITTQNRICGLLYPKD